MRRLRDRAHRKQQCHDLSHQYPRCDITLLSDYPKSPAAEAFSSEPLGLVSSASPEAPAFRFTYRLDSRRDLNEPILLHLRRALSMDLSCLRCCARMSKGGSHRAVYHSIHHGWAVICIMILSDFSTIVRRFDFPWNNEVFYDQIPQFPFFMISLIRVA